jgi:predicted porin
MLKCLFYHYPVRAWFPVYVYDEEINYRPISQTTAYISRYYIINDQVYYFNKTVDVYIW